MQVTRDGKQRRSKAEWKEVVSQYRHSGLNLHDFAKQQSISLASLQRWNRRLGADAQPRQSDFVDVTPAPKAISSSWQAEIELPGGVVLRLRG